MNQMHRMSHAVVALCVIACCARSALAEEARAPFEPRVGQEGKDVIWVPTPEVLVEKMLDMAQVTPNDFVVDLGSGDGRNVIAAARRGARALGVEYNPEMVALSKRIAGAAGVAGRAQFVQGDMFEADVTQATVLTLFLLTDNLDRLAPKFLGMKPGSRIVSNGFEITGWAHEDVQKSEGDCGAWCTAYLYLVPARVSGTWRLTRGELTLEQYAQTVSGTYTAGGATTPVTNGRLRGDRITFTAGGSDYTGRVHGQTMQGRVVGMTSGAWSATRSDL